jgi:FLVCR family MFS transporter
VLCLLSAAAFMWFSLACSGYLDRSTIVLYVASGLGGLFLNGTVALFYELAVETTYPIAEGITTGVLTTMNNVGCAIFLILPEIPGLGKRRCVFY